MWIFSLFLGKSGETKLLPEVMAQLMRDIALGKKMAGTADRGGFFLSLCKILVTALCYGGILCK